MTAVADRPAEQPEDERRRSTDRRREGRRLVRRSTVLGGLVCAGANTSAAVIVFVFLAFVLPTPEAAERRLLLNLVLGSSYLVVALAIGLVSGILRARRRLAWLREGRPADAAGQRAVIGLPLAMTWVQLRLWALAAVAFGLVNATASVLLGVEVALTILIGGLVSSASTYFLVERVNRPLLARALEDAGLDAARGVGVALRATAAWALGSAMPVAGLALLAGLALGLDISQQELAVAALVLSLTGLGSGLLITIVFARSVADPLRDLRRALADLAAGRTDVRVAVSDASEVGVLQTGFNQMVAGLAERDRIRELFGRHVGRDVAEKALEEGVALGGEVRHVAVVFTDVVGSTTLAERAGPEAAVEALNHLFGLVVDLVEREGGTVTTFAGDAAVGVWGAPLGHDEPETAALRAARHLAAAVEDDPDALPVGIGVAAGPVVAGNIGAHRRVEYTVIGDAVNRAARLCDLAKDRAGACVLADAATLDAADGEERRRWRTDGEVTLRGRAEPTRLAVPTT